ncbi:head-tail connector protein [Melghirimyces algeriensis]|uniref:Phage gp6-like head-tail connector protein n=1 Tax=Melghirimyces algeriensis TaxID=910412 RepID=A0A521C6K5_9BACL|nr:head-tail connector protein [Melghirimyces algeriensis]SMO54995.1 hypothetical protein SAMN06264849_103151 [Melghirimyces algeriensis]
MALIDDVKLALRVTAVEFDSEIQDLIDGAKLDLQLSGVVNLVDTDPLIKRAVIVYCKAHFGYDNPEADRFLRSYDLLKMHLTLSSDYTEVI